MRALGECLILLAPPDAKQTEGGIVVPDTIVDRNYRHGRVIARGDGSTINADVGDIVLYDPSGNFVLEMRGSKPELICVLGNACLSTITEEECQQLGLQVPHKKWQPRAAARKASA